MTETPAPLVLTGEPDEPGDTAVAALHDDRAGKREQRIHTPAEIWRGLDRLWPEGVQMDPCSSPRALCHPPASCYPEHEDPLHRDGLAVPWLRRCFVNPPYDNLEPWLARFAQAWECVALVPVRTHRKWYRAALLRCSAITLLNPIAFVGHRNTFPAPLSLLYRGDHAGRFAESFDGLGDTHRGAFGQASQQIGLFG